MLWIGRGAYAVGGILRLDGPSNWYISVQTQMSTGRKLIIIELRTESSIHGLEGFAENITWNCTALEDGTQARETPLAL